MNNNAKRYNSKKTKRRKKSSLNQMYTYLMYLIISVGLLSRVSSYSKFIVSDINDDSSRVSGIAVQTIVPEKNMINIDCTATEPKGTFSFQVTNKKDNLVCEVSFKYSIIITMQQALPSYITMKLNGNVGTITNNGKTYTFTNESYKFSASTEETHQHELQFISEKLQEEENISISGISISLNIEQID